MARFRKEALHEGDWHLPDGRVFTCAPGELGHYRRRAKDMIAAGLSIPVCWRHQDVTPVTAGQRLALTDAEEKARAEKLVLGWVEDAHDSAGPLELEFEAPVEADAERLKAVRFVSPEIRTDFIDGTGRLWPGKSITHLAVTSRPVQTGQRPFTRLAADGDDDTEPPVRLSLEGWRMAAEDDVTGTDSDNDNADNAPPAPPAAIAPDPDLPGLIEALKAAGLTIPGEVRDLKHLTIAVKANAKGDADGDGKKNDDDADPNAAAPDTAGNVVKGAASSPPPISMSLDSDLGRELTALRREKMTRRINDLRSVGTATKGELLAELSAERLSLEGTRGELAVKVEMLEKLPALPLAEATRLGQDVKTVPNPHDAATSERQKRIDADIEARAAKITGRRPARAAK